jgi:hypothetical protein
MCMNLGYDPRGCSFSLPHCHMLYVTVPCCVPCMHAGNTAFSRTSLEELGIESQIHDDSTRIATAGVVVHSAMSYHFVSTTRKECAELGRQAAKNAPRLTTFVCRL